MISSLNENNPLLRLISRSSVISRTLFQLLQQQDIAKLRLTAQVFNENILANIQLQNFLFYSEHMAVERSFSVDKEIYGLSQRICKERIWNLCSNNQLSFDNNAKQAKNLQNNLMSTLNSIIDKHHSKMILQQFKRILIDPQPPRPVMRRKTVGDFCKSSIQIKMATEGYQAHEQLFLSQEDEQLKRALLEKSQKILQFSLNKNNSGQMLELRFRGELGKKSLLAECELVRIIQLVLYVTQNNIFSIKVYLQSAKDKLSSVEFVQQFVYRYSCFRNCINQLDEKFQYIFQHFSFAFSQAFPSHPLRPRFSLWRFMMKQWIMEMSGFHGLANKTVSKMIIQNIQTQIQCQIANQVADEESCSQFNNCFKLQKFKAPRSSILNASALDPSVISFLIQQYTQYLVDVSSNSFNVHWFGSTQVRFGRSYSQFQKSILWYAGEYFQLIINSFSSGYVKIKLCYFFVEASRNLLKACTSQKIQSIYKKYVDEIFENLKNISENRTYVLQQLFICCNWQQQDTIIRSMNQNRKIKQETAEQRISFFSLQQVISLKQVEEAMLIYNSESNDRELEMGLDGDVGEIF